MTPAAIGSVAMLRIAGIPIDRWTAGGCPELFRDLDRLAAERANYRATARAVADAIGSEVIPDPTITAALRGAALRLRRALHNGATAPDDAAAVAASAPGHVATGIATLSEHSRRLHDAEAAIATAIAAEEHRLLGLPWALLLAGPTGRRAVADGDITVGPDIAERLQAAEPWSTKRMRQRNEYLWRMVTRAATRATPRGWLGHVAWLPVTGCRDDELLGIDDTAATARVDNVVLRSHTPVAELLANPSTLVTTAPACRVEASHVVVPALRDGAFVETRLRRTPALTAVLRSTATAVTVETLLDALAGPDVARRDAMSRLIQHLAEAHVLQLDRPARTRHEPWHPIERHEGGGGDAYVDVYRRPTAPLSRDRARRLEHLVRSACRVLEIVDDQLTVPPALPPGLDERPRSILDVLAECAAADSRVGPGDRHHHDWPRRAVAGPRYRRLLDLLDARIGEPDAPPATIDIDDAMLDAVGGPCAGGDDPAGAWPFDVLLRLVDDPSGLIAVLDQMSPAGVLDARFAQSPAGGRAASDHVDAYRRFLREVEARADGRFVELLAPPLHPKAANAVRRPAYTDLWTGDPRRSDYTDVIPPGSTYVPPGDITIRLHRGHLVAEANGTTIWPTFHTARHAPPPWDTFVDLLTLASPQPHRWRRRPLMYSLDAWPDRDHVPRITLNGELALSAAQWRLRRHDLWVTDQPMARRVAAMHDARRRLRMPRWVLVARHVHDEPRAVDLESVTAIRMIERAAQHGGDLLVTEMLPGPGQLPVRNHAEGGAPCMAELLLRTPVDGSPTTVAASVADRITRTRGRRAESVASLPGGGVSSERIER